MYMYSIYQRVSKCDICSYDHREVSVCAEVACVAYRTRDKYLSAMCVSDLLLLPSLSLSLFVTHTHIQFLSLSLCFCIQVSCVCILYVRKDTGEKRAKVDHVIMGIIDIREWKIWWAGA